MLQGWDPSWTVRRFDAAGAIDGSGRGASHPSGVSAVLERHPDGTLTLAALGPTEQIASSTRWAGVPVTDRRGRLLIPGLVNAHTHLDLTHIGPRPHDPGDGFSAWIDMIIRERLSEEAPIVRAVRNGVGFLLAGGTVLVGDIAGVVAGKPSTIPGRALAEDGRVNGVSFVEFFAQGAGGEGGLVGAVDARDSLSATPDPLSRARIVFGLQPHAPYSVGWGYYGRLIAGLDADVPVCTHLAESTAEREFIARAAGPFRALLERLGLWDPLTAESVGDGRTPIAHLADHLRAGRQSVVHCNDVSDEDLDTLVGAQAPVIYCPRSSAYFGAERDFGPHRYRNMLSRGLTVALGTDSIVNLDTPDRISVWDEMRFLHRRDSFDPSTLLKMATVNGAVALRRDPVLFTFSPLGTLAGLAAIRVPDANPTLGGAELLRRALAMPEGGEEGHPELLAIGRV
ncbi:MAG TPA: amidohydrolase family protein [Phycisphaerales bacterium]|nr:amidohydrolase family protein [Phycisphaerales bacterium]